MRESGPAGKSGVERLRLVSVIKTAVMVHMVRIPRNSQINKIMATLETQYKNFLIDNPTSTFTFEEWKKDHGVKIGAAIKRSSTLNRILDEVRRPEYKEKRMKERIKLKEELTFEYQNGFYVGEEIVTRHLPTITTDMLQTRTQIKVSDEDVEENKRLESEWWKTTKYGNSPNEEKHNENWELYKQHNIMLEKKYLPTPLKCHMSLMNIRDEKDFKDGLIHSLWNCDMCTYSLKPEDIKIYDDEDLWFTIIEFILRDEE